MEWTEPEWVYRPPCGALHGRDQVLHGVSEPIPEHFDSFEPRPKGVSRTLAVPFAHVWRLRDGNCVSMRDYIAVAEV